MAERTQKMISPPLLPVKLPKNPWDQIEIDFKGLLNEGPHTFLLVVDYYSRWQKWLGDFDEIGECN